MRILTAEIRKTLTLRFFLILLVAIAANFLLFRHSLRHIINIDIITENFTGIMILYGNRGSGKADVRCLGKAHADDPCNTGQHFDNQVTSSVPDCLDLFSQTILASVRLVRHNDNISALGQSLFAHFEFLHGSEENAVCLCVCQQLL